MLHPPRAVRAPIIDRRGLIMVLAMGCYIGLVTLFLYHWYLGGDAENVMMAQTVAFTAIIVLEKVNVFNFRSFTQPLTKIGLFSNPWIVFAWLATISLQVAAIYLPVLQTALHTVPLGLEEWVIILIFSAPIFVVPEFIKARYARQS